MSLFPSGSFPAILLAETRSEVRKSLRMPAYLVPTLVLPAIIYAVFGLMLNNGRIGGMAAPAYMLASYGTLGIVGASLFGMGVSVAVERGQGWLTLKAATPMPPLAYFGGKVLMCMALGIASTALLSIMGVLFGDVRLDAGQWAMLFVTLAAGSAPFCALGCAIGYLAGPNSAAGITNLLYLPLSVCSGLWVPVEGLPKIMQHIAPWLPPYHLSRLALHAIGMPIPLNNHAWFLAGYTALFAWLASLAFKRQSRGSWG